MPDLSTFGRQIPSDPPFFVYSLSLSSQQMSDFDVRTSFVRLTLDMYTSDWSSPSISSSSPSSPKWLMMIMIPIVFTIVFIISIIFMVSRLTSFTLSGHRLSVWPSSHICWISYICISSVIGQCHHIYQIVLYFLFWLSFVCLAFSPFFTGFTHVWEHPRCSTAGHLPVQHVHVSLWNTVWHTVSKSWQPL